MNIPIVSELINKRNRSKLRAINKGYKQLKDESKLDFTIQLRWILSKTEIYDTSKLKGLFYQDSFNVELSIRQYFTMRFLGVSFNKSILYSIGSDTPLRHPLPKEWRDALIAQGVSVNSFICTVLWYVNSFVFWSKSALQGLKSICVLLKEQSSLGRYVYFDGLADNNISTNLNEHNIINWYLRWKYRNIEIDSICHDVRGISNFKLGKVEIIQTVELPKLKNTALLQYVGFLIHIIIYSFIYLFFKPAYGFLLGEFIKFKRVDLANDADLAREYLFHNSSLYYRPIWTYAAESKGSKILFYFYSTHTDYFYSTYVENFKNKGGCIVGLPLHLMSWPHYLVWNEFQADFIKSSNQYNPVIEEVGHIWFSSSGESVSISSNSIAVFDATPRRPMAHVLMGESLDYHNFDIANQFLNDIQLVLDKNNMNISHKIKRVIKVTHRAYLRNIMQLKQKSNYVEIHPSVDALQIIQKTKACISIPFTSTAVIAKQEGKPSVYYDPSGVIQKNNRAAHDIPVLSGINELEDWVNSIDNKVN